MVSAEADSAHGAHTVVLAAPVREIVVVPFLQDVMRSSVVGLLVHHPPTNKGTSVSQRFSMNMIDLFYMLQICEVFY